VPFLTEADTLIASPALLARLPLKTPADIDRHILLGSETRPGDWTDWLEQAGLPQKIGRRHHLYDHFFVTLHAVADGLGLGIGPLPVLQADIASGRLTTPFPEIIVPRSGYVALIPFDADKSPALTRFIDWLTTDPPLPEIASCVP
jgi:DNA-binding transcriptional LysR family regulator